VPSVTASIGGAPHAGAGNDALTTTKLEISNQKLHAAVHHVYNRLPANVRAQLDTANLALIADVPHAVTKGAVGALGMCERLPGGRQTIFLAPRLAHESDEKVMLVAPTSWRTPAKNPSVARTVASPSPSITRPNGAPTRANGIQRLTFQRRQFRGGLWHGHERRTADSPLAAS
jgi:hypothetical protein